MKLSLWPLDVAALSRAASSLDAWMADVEARVLVAKENGSSLLVLPEYACVTWLTFAPDDIATRDEVAWLASQARTVVPLLAALAKRHDVGILAGTMPVALASGSGSDSFANRAVLALPEGLFFQDKLALTPWERDVDGWLLTPGDELRIVEWRGVRIAIAICLDVEVPALAALLSELADDGSGSTGQAPIDLLIVPSMTSSRAGYNRVFGCAKARVIELCCPVAVVGAIGTLVLKTREEPNVSGAAVFLPCESIHVEGVAGAIGPFDSGVTHTVGDEHLLHVDARVDDCRHLRRGAADVWPPRLRKGVSVMGHRVE